MRLIGHLRGREPLPSLDERHPEARTATRHLAGIQEVPLEAIVGTARNPSQNTSDFLPLPELRRGNWEARWQRIQRAIDRLVVLPPIELFKVGDEYWVVDGHNRVAAARQAGAVAIDAVVTELRLPGEPIQRHSLAGSAGFVGSDAVRQAAEGRFSRTADQRIEAPELPREELGRRLAAEESVEAAEAAEAAQPIEEGPPGESQ